MQEVYAQPFAYQDNFPLVSGCYEITVFVRNRVLHQYTVAEGEIEVPRFETDKPLLTDVVLAFDTREIESSSPVQSVGAYQLENIRIQPAAENLFGVGESIHLVAQTLGEVSNYQVVFELNKDGKTDKIVETKARESGLTIDYLQLDKMEGGRYELISRLVSSAGETVSEIKVPVNVSPRSNLDRPGFVYRRGINTNISGILEFAKGEQLWRLSRFDEAKSSFEFVTRTGNKRFVSAHWKLASIYLQDKRADDALTLLKPLEKEFPNRVEVQEGLGWAMYLNKQYEAAITYFVRTLELRFPDASLLNALGDCYQKTRNPQASLKTYRMSLELDADQPDVKARISLLEKTSGFF